MTPTEQFVQELKSAFHGGTVFSRNQIFAVIDQVVAGIGSLPIKEATETDQAALPTAVPVTEKPRIIPGYRPPKRKRS